MDWEHAKERATSVSNSCHGDRSVARDLNVKVWDDVQVLHTVDYLMSKSTSMRIEITQVLVYNRMQHNSAAVNGT